MTYVARFKLFTEIIISEEIRENFKDYIELPYLDLYYFLK